MSLKKMGLTSTKGAPVLNDPAPINKSLLVIHSGLLSCPQSGNTFTNGGLTIPKKKPGKLDDVRSNSWLDAMNASSPPRKKILKDLNGDFPSEDDIAYHAWMVKYPSALSSFELILKRVKNRKIVMFLDYDGTLSPIVDDPDRAFMSADMRSAVKSVAKYVPTAIISGRSRDKVSELVGLSELYYAGSHGMDIMFPVTDDKSMNHLNYSKFTDKQGKEVNLFQPAHEFAPMINESWPVIAQRVHDILKDYPRLRLTYGRKVFEVRPTIDWNKGKAVEFLLETLGQLLPVPSPINW
ncbi:hypothetical protein Leryth_003270 [Lithospermum erythrorhizon]|nr:hypothetical protein Leryth_003270 [Lithospermum erythrorhizon]